jgi:hypothetical protein
MRFPELQRRFLRDGQAKTARDDEEALRLDQPGGQRRPVKLEGGIELGGESRQLADPHRRAMPPQSRQSRPARRYRTWSPPPKWPGAQRQDHIGHRGQGEVSH